MKMAVNIPCLNVQVIVIVIVIVQVTSFVINVIRMRPSLDVVEENKALERQTTASIQLCCKISSWIVYSVKERQAVLICIIAM